jgi:hypothetical protein
MGTAERRHAALALGKSFLLPSRPRSTSQASTSNKTSNKTSDKTSNKTSHKTSHKTSNDTAGGKTRTSCKTSALIKTVSLKVPKDPKRPSLASSIAYRTLLK